MVRPFSHLHSKPMTHSANIVTERAIFHENYSSMRIFQRSTPGLIIPKAASVASHTALVSILGGLICRTESKISIKITEVSVKSGTSVENEQVASLMIRSEGCRIMSSIPPGPVAPTRYGTSSAPHFRILNERQQKPHAQTYQWKESSGGHQMHLRRRHKYIDVWQSQPQI